MVFSFIVVTKSLNIYQDFDGSNACCVAVNWLWDYDNSNSA